MGNILILENNVRGRRATRARDRQSKLGAVLRTTRICDIFFFVQGALRRDSRESHVPTPLPHTIRRVTGVANGVGCFSVPYVPYV